MNIKLDPMIGRFLASLSPKDLGEIYSVTQNGDPAGLMVVWVWQPAVNCVEFEGQPVFNAQLGKYAFSGHDEPEIEPDADRPF